MNIETLRQNYAALIAFDNGKAIEYSCIGKLDWERDLEPSWDFVNFNYRPKPEPKTRPWQSRNVPALCWIRNTTMLDGQCGLVEAISRDGIRFWGSWKNWLELISEGYEYSEDLESWHKCEVSE